MRLSKRAARLLTYAVFAMNVFACHAPDSDQAVDSNSSLSSTPGTAASFQNPIVGQGADPWVVFKDGYYYYCTANGNDGISVARTKNLLEIGKDGNGRRVWTAPQGTDHSGGTWAAELHFLDGRWYIYYAASNTGAGNNAGHRMFVLESVSDDAMGEYTFKGKIAAATDRWAIDGTVLENNDGKRYFVWSGWDGFNDYQQNLYIAPMINPWTLAQPDPLTVTRIEAESSTTNHTITRSASLASNGNAVGHIDFADSYVEFGVDVQAAGSYQIDVRYSNGNENRATSTHKVSVNGGDSGTARYTWTTTYENFQTTQVFVNLSAGHNTLRFGKGDGFAELDRFEVKPKGTDRVLLSMPEFDSERLGGPAFVNEGPEVLQKNGTIHLVYSASGSWTNDYNLVQLTFQGGDILDRKNWVKRGSVFASANEVYGPGHASFTKSPDGKEDWIVYHAAKSKGSGWSRNIRTQLFSFDAANNPVFGQPMPLSTVLSVPSGTL